MVVEAGEAVQRAHLLPDHVHSRPPARHGRALGAPACAYSERDLWVRRRMES